MLDITANTNIVDMSHDFGCYGNNFGRNVCVTMVIKIGILLNWLSGAEYRVNITVYVIGKLKSSAF